MPARDVRHFYLEAVNRIGMMELARRTGLTYESLSSVLNGKARSVRKANLRAVMLELISIRRKNEYSIRPQAAWRITRRFSTEVCAGCGTSLDNYSAGCGTCVDRAYKREARSEDQAA